jgi:predicted RNase H-like nuclease (RuvC/YqgF family)
MGYREVSYLKRQIEDRDRMKIEQYRIEEIVNANTALTKQMNRLLDEVSYLKRQIEDRDRKIEQYRNVFKGIEIAITWGKGERV